MLNSFFQRHTAAGLLSCAALLTACGGGGDSKTNSTANANTGTINSTNSGSTPAPATAPALAFSPSVVTASFESGSTSTMLVTASVKRPADFTGQVYAAIVDSAGVLQPNARIDAQTETQYAAILRASTSLAPGSYKGNFTVNLCKDQACTQHFPGSPMQLPYEFTVAAVASSLTAVANGPLSQTLNQGVPAPAPVTVAVSMNGTPRNWTASSDVSWLVLKNASGTGSGSFTATFDNSQSALGTQQGSITVKASDGQLFVLHATMNTIAKAFTASQNSFNFTAVNGTTIAPQQVSFDIPGGGTWTAGNDVTWLSATPNSGTLPGQLKLTVDPNKVALASGSYNGNLILQSPDAAPRNLLVTLNLVKPTLSTSIDTVVLGGPTGRDFSAKQLTLYLDTLKNNWPWTIGPLPAWASVSASSGQANMDGTAVQFNASPNIFWTGSRSALVTATAKVNGDTLTKSIALTMNRDQEKFLPSETGLAMVSVPGWSRLVRTFTVSDNYGTGTGWWASSDKSWLQVAISGNTVTLTGDPSQLPDDTISYATVTLSSGVAGVTTPETVRVALWKGSQAPVARTEITGTYWKVMADAIRPLVYVHGGGSTLDVYNVYTGQKVATSAVLGGALGDMAMSQNGDRLYVYDTANKSVVVVNVQTLAKQDAWVLSSGANPMSRLISVRPNGEEFVLTTTGDAFRVANGQRTAVQLNGGAMDATRDGKRLYVQDALQAPSTTKVYNLDYTDFSNGSLSVATAGSFSAGSNGADIAVSLDGKRVYTANANTGLCGINDGETYKSLNYLPGGSLYPNSVKVDSFGRAFCGAAGLNNAVDVWMHSSTGVKLNQFKFSSTGAPLQYRQMAVSADGMLLIGLTQTPVLSIMAVGP